MEFGYYNIDCMDGLKQIPDKFIDLAIVDPPYGGVTKGGYMFKNDYGKGQWHCNDYDLTIWGQEAPGPEYFRELFRVSKNQIIWGGNYFIEQIAKNSQCWIVWDKKRPENASYADAELAWTSFDEAVKTFRYMWNGYIQEDQKNKEHRIHPTQKPVKLYKWLLSKFANPGDIILDTHVGSASSLIACEEKGFDYIAFEIHPAYYEKSVERLETFRKQIRFNF